MSKKDKVKDMLIDGMRFKQISINNKKGKSTKFKPIGEGIRVGMHVVEGKSEENHLDIYKDGKDIGKSRNYKPEIFGVAIHHFGKDNSEISILLQPLIKSAEWDNLFVVEKVHEYQRRVKFVNEKEKRKIKSINLSG